MCLWIWWPCLTLFEHWRARLACTEFIRSEFPREGEIYIYFALLFPLFFFYCFFSISFSFSAPSSFSFSFSISFFFSSLPFFFYFFFFFLLSLFLRSLSGESPSFFFFLKKCEGSLYKSALHVCNDTVAQITRPQHENYYDYSCFSSCHLCQYHCHCVLLFIRCLPRFFYSDDCQFLLVFYRPENNEERIFAQVSKYRSYLFLNIHHYYFILIQKSYGD